MLFRTRHHGKRHSLLAGILRLLGPGLITGAADDDPSGIATYSQAGAQFGYSLTWLMLVAWPLMAAIQEVSARIGRVTGKGIAANLREHYSPAMMRGMVGLLLIANFINLGADLGAMGDAVRLVIGGPAGAYVVLLAAFCAALEIFSSYERYVRTLKWMTLSLFAYVAVVFVVHVPWAQVGYDTIVPRLSWDKDYLTVVVAVLGTTISPYLFFWQASEEAEEERINPSEHPLTEAPAEAPREIRRIEFDTYIGMFFSDLIGFFIIVTTAATLHAHNITDVQTSEQAAEALRPIAGDFAFYIFALGILGTGLLAIPVLAGSAAYALAEAMGWRTGLAAQPRDAKRFYATIVVGTVIGTAINFVNLDPMKALFWTAVINGVVAVPLMVLMMLMTMRSDVMGQFTLPRPLWVVGWLSTGVMAVAVVTMFVTSL